MGFCSKLGLLFLGVLFHTTPPAQCTTTGAQTTAAPPGELTTPSGEKQTENDENTALPTSARKSGHSQPGSYPTTVGTQIKTSSSDNFRKPEATVTSEISMVTTDSLDTITQNLHMTTTSGISEWRTTPDAETTPTSLSPNTAIGKVAHEASAETYSPDGSTSLGETVTTKESPVTTSEHEPDSTAEMSALEPETTSSQSTSNTTKSEISMSSKFIQIENITKSNIGDSFSKVHVDFEANSTSVVQDASVTVTGFADLHENVSFYETEKSSTYSEGLPITEGITIGYSNSTQSSTVTGEITVEHDNVTENGTVNGAITMVYSNLTELSTVIEEMAMNLDTIEYSNVTEMSTVSGETSMDLDTIKYGNVTERSTVSGDMVMDLDTIEYSNVAERSTVTIGYRNISEMSNMSNPLTTSMEAENYTNISGGMITEVMVTTEHAQSGSTTLSVVTDMLNDTTVSDIAFTDIPEYNETSFAISTNQSTVTIIPMEVVTNDTYPADVSMATSETMVTEQHYGNITQFAKNSTDLSNASDYSIFNISSTTSFVVTTSFQPPLYIIFVVKIDWAEFCVDSIQKDFKNVLCQLMNNPRGDGDDHSKENATDLPVKNDAPVTLEMVVFHGESPCPGEVGTQSLIRNKRDAERNLDTFPVNVYLADPDGYYSYSLTAELADLLKNRNKDDIFKGTVLENKVIDIKLYGTNFEQEVVVDGSHVNNTWRPSVGIIMAIVFGILAAIILLAFLVMHLVIQRRRRRMKKMRHSYENRYSIDTLQGLGMDSIQLTGIRMAANRWGYVNPALVIDDRDFNSNPLNFPALSSIVKAPVALEEEFMMLPNYIARVTDVPKGSEDKNRYANIIPVPETRVPLNPGSSPDEPSNYINANFVRGYLCAPKSYIATQAPLENTREDFWHMVYEQKAQAILMLTALEESGSSRCVEYWPNTDGGDTQRKFGELEVTLIKRDIRREWITSALRVTKANSKQSLDVYHFWLTSWPTQGLPDPRTILGFLLAARPYMEKSIGPTVVHCSPGTGRTGVLLATDIQMLAYDDAKLVDILSCVCGLRQDRAGLVQTRDQYKFIYKAVLEYAQTLHSTSRNPSRASSINSLHMHS